ncbi:hypothetical protein PLESTB_000259600 [Pleodorina starrii]|uniref:Protein kinase domain-containing protein n=1 Tax=Pleodorina starrii TaxID=330485 RepID=A0A9W6BCD2_9CHLO|nr:hypothetical protein PLESTM_001010500 [Pleodorina starrii]GLC49569.1 hypothetical protein PLESTB_000259600 [Pleodorina starrii]GLC77270.1 hypothetical protein PLESTF_001907100 [Pleodorina starrii]
MQSHGKTGESGAVKSLLNLLRFGKKKKTKEKKDVLKTPPTEPVEPPPVGSSSPPIANASTPLEITPASDVINNNQQAASMAKGVDAQPDGLAPRNSEDTQPGDVPSASMQHEKLLAALESTQNMADPQQHSQRMSFNAADFSGVLFAHRTNTQSGTGMVLPPRMAMADSASPGVHIGGATSGCFTSSEAPLQRIVEDGAVRGSYTPYTTTTVAPMHSAAINTAPTDADSSNAPLYSVANNLQDMLFVDYDTLERFQSRGQAADRGLAGATAAAATSGSSVSAGLRRDMTRAPHVPSLLRPQAASRQPRTTPQLGLGSDVPVALPEPAAVADDEGSAERTQAPEAGAGAQQGPGADTGPREAAELAAAAGVAQTSQSAPLVQLQQQRQRQQQQKQQQQQAIPMAALPSRVGELAQVQPAEQDALPGSPPELQLDGAGVQPPPPQGLAVPPEQIPSNLRQHPAEQQLPQSELTRANSAGAQLASHDEPRRVGPSLPGAGTASGSGAAAAAAAAASPDLDAAAAPAPAPDTTAPGAASAHVVGAEQQQQDVPMAGATDASLNVNLRRVPAPKPAAAAVADVCSGPSGRADAARPSPWQAAAPATAAPPPLAHLSADFSSLVAGPALPSYSQQPAPLAESPAPLSRPMKLTTACLSAYTTLYDHGGDQSFQRALQRKMQLVYKWMAASDLTAPPDPRLEVPMESAAAAASDAGGGGGGFDHAAGAGYGNEPAAPVGAAAGSQRAELGGTAGTTVAAAVAQGALGAVGREPPPPPGSRGHTPGPELLAGLKAITAHNDRSLGQSLHHVSPTQHQLHRQQSALHGQPAGTQAPADARLGAVPGGAIAAAMLLPRNGQPPQAAAVKAPQGTDLALAATGAQQLLPLQHSISDLYGKPQAVASANLPPRMLAGSEADPASATVVAANAGPAAAAGAGSAAPAANAKPPGSSMHVRTAQPSRPQDVSPAPDISAAAQEQQPQPQEPQRSAAAAPDAAVSAQSSNGGASTQAAAGQGQSRTKTIAVASHCPLELQPQPPGAPWTIDDFSLLKKLYEGSLSVVCQAQHKRSGRHVALKIYKRSRLHEMERFQLAREICLHIRIVHPHVVGLFAAWKDSKYVYLALDWAPLGNMFDYLVARGGRLSEEEAARVVMRPLLSALAFLHSQHFIHRDVKLENLLLDASSCLQLADFGLAIDQKFEQANTRLGTFGYFAPEVLDCPLKKGPFDMKDTSVPGYDSRVDVWSAGVVGYEVLTGRAPFSASSPAKIIQAIRSRVLEFPGISEEGRDFLRSALTRDPAARPTAKQLLAHPWILRRCGGAGGGPASALPLPAVPSPAPDAAVISQSSPTPLLASSSATMGEHVLAAAPPQMVPLTADGAVGPPAVAQAGKADPSGGAGAEAAPAAAGSGDSSAKAGAREAPSGIAPRAPAPLQP